VLGDPQIKWNSFDLEFSHIGGNLNVEFKSKTGSFGLKQIDGELAATERLKGSALNVLLNTR
jgi:hypothetical protein